MSEAAPRRQEYVEDRVPLDDIAETIAAVVESHGGEVTATGAQSVSFSLPVRQGVAASGAIQGTVSWEESEEGGVLTIRADDEVTRPSFSHVALLVAGTIGALLWLLWPFYPALGPASWVGGALAFAAYFLTLRRTRGGIVARLLEHIVDVQRGSV
ncbi:MAG: hypothetical protein ACRD2J_00260 [Thermoanaerobaculia bacterium]